MIDMAAIVVMCATYADGEMHCDVRASNNRQDVSLVTCREKLDKGIISITKDLLAAEPGTIMSYSSAECVPLDAYAERLGSVPKHLQDLGYGEVNIKFY